MRRRLVIVPALVSVLALLIPATSGHNDVTTAQAANCSFTLGFKLLRDMIPNVVGDCLEDEWHNAFNGDALQQTTGGLLVWRKLDNWTAFTNGATTWLNGPEGLATRPNAGPLFPWESAAPAGPAAQPPAPPPPPQPSTNNATATPTSTAVPGKPVITLDLSDDRIDQGGKFTVQLEATDTAGIDTVWWWASDTSDSALQETHEERCRGSNPCRRNFNDITTTDTGRIIIHAKARNTAGVESDEVTFELRVRTSTNTPTPTATGTATPTPTVKI